MNCIWMLSLEETPFSDLGLVSYDQMVVRCAESSLRFVKQYQHLLDVSSRTSNVHIVFEHEDYKLRVIFSRNS